MKKKACFVLVFGVVVIAFAIIGKRGSFKMPSESDLLLANVEALSQNENSYDCILTKDECKFVIKTQGQMNILVSKLGMYGAIIGATVDLSSGTQIYKRKSWWQNGVRCGNDITCNDFLKDLGL